MKTIVKTLLIGCIMASGLCMGENAQAKVTLKTPSMKISNVKNTSVKATAKKGIYTKVVKKKGKKVYDKISGYQIYRRLGGSGSFKKVYTAKVKGGKIGKTKTFTGLKSGTYYAFKIRTYKKSGKKTYYSKWGYVGVTTKKQSDDTTSGSNRNPKTEDKDTTVTPSPSGTCERMNTYYKGYTVEQMDAIFNADYQRKTVDRVNMLRANRGLPPYQLDETLCQLAQVRAQENVAMQTWITSNLDKGHYRDATKTRYWNSIFSDYGVSHIQSFSENINWGGGADGIFFFQYGDIGLWDDMSREVWGVDDYSAVYTNWWLDSVAGNVESASHRKSLIASSVYADCMGVAYVWNADHTYSVWVEVFGKYK